MREFDRQCALSSNPLEANVRFMQTCLDTGRVDLGELTDFARGLKGPCR